MNYTLDFKVFTDQNYIYMLLSGLAVTVFLMLISGLLALSISYVVVFFKFSTKKYLNAVAFIYVELFRNVPALVQIFFWSFAFPTIFPLDLRQKLFFSNALVDWSYAHTGIHPFYFMAIILGITLNSSAYIVEIIRSGINAIPTEQIYTGLTAGLTRKQIINDILLPQSFVISLPPLTSRLIHNMKNTTLAVFLPIPDLLSQLQTISSKTFRGFETLIVGGLIYLVLSLLLSFGAFILQKKWQSPYKIEDNQIWIN